MTPTPTETQAEVTAPKASSEEQENHPLAESSRLIGMLEALYRAVMSGALAIGLPSWLSFKKSEGSNDSQPLSPSEVEVAIDRTIRNHAIMAGGVGFVSNIGGLITLPVALPANLVGITAIQMAMIQEIARLRGLDPENPTVMAFALMALIGTGATELFDTAAAQAGTSVVRMAITTIPGSVIASINQTVGFRLLTKFGRTGVINLGRWIPLAGGAICAAIDSSTTYAVGKAAKSIFDRFEAEASDSHKRSMGDDGTIYL